MRSKLAQKERMALSPGESSLLRHIKRFRNPANIRQISKLPEFHGWDSDTLEIMLQRLSGMGLVSWDGVLAGPSSFKMTADAEDVVARFLNEKE